MSKPRMDIHSTPGTVITFDCDGGAEFDREDSQKKLEVGKQYTVRETFIGSSCSLVRLVNHAGAFNTVLFASTCINPTVLVGELQVGTQKDEDKKIVYGGGDITVKDKTKKDYSSVSNNVLLETLLESDRIETYHGGHDEDNYLSLREAVLRRMKP